MISFPCFGGTGTGCQFCIVATVSPLHLQPESHWCEKPSEAVRSYPSDQYQGSQLHLKNKNTKHGDNETSHRTLEEVLVSVKGDLYRFVIWKYSVPCETLILIMLISWMLWTSPFTSFVCWAEFPYPKQLFSFWDISWHKELLLVRWWLFGTLATNDSLM